MPKNAHFCQKVVSESRILQQSLIKFINFSSSEIFFSKCKQKAPVSFSMASPKWPAIQERPLRAQKKVALLKNELMIVKAYYYIAVAASVCKLASLIRCCCCCELSDSGWTDEAAQVGYWR